MELLSLLEKSLYEEGVELDSWHIQHDGSATWDGDIGHGSRVNTRNRRSPPGGGLTPHLEA